MDVDTYIRTRSDAWRRLEELLQIAESRLDDMPASALADLGRLYRLTASDLAVAQRDYSDHQLVTYLNGLVARAHALVYQPAPVGRRGLADFFKSSFPRLYRRLLPFALVSLALFWVPGVVGFGAVQHSERAREAILGPMAGSLVDRVEDGDNWADIAPAVRSTAASAIMSNNIQVIFLTFAGGMTAGLVTVYVLVMNGLVLGAVAGVVYAGGIGMVLTDFVVAHGFLELSVVYVAGACGLYMADGLLRPGLLSRTDALADRARTSVQVILGCVPVLVLAGLIEGFISPSGMATGAKLAVGLASGLALHTYWLLGGRAMSQGRESRYSRVRALSSR